MGDGEGDTDGLGDDDAEATGDGAQVAPGRTGKAEVGHGDAAEGINSGISAGAEDAHAQELPDNASTVSSPTTPTRAPAQPRAALIHDAPEATTRRTERTPERTPPAAPGWLNCTFAP